MVFMVAQGVWADIYPYTYKYSKGYHFYKMDEWELVSSDSRMCKMDLSMSGQSYCMLSVYWSDMEDDNLVAALANRAYYEGDEDDILQIGGNLRLSNGEELAIEEINMSDNRKEAFQGSTSIGSLMCMMNLCDFSTSTVVNMAGWSKNKRHAYVVDRLSKYDIASMRIGGHVLAFGTMNTSETLRSMFIKLRGDVNQDALFTYTEPSYTPPSYTPTPAPRYSAPRSSVQITSFDMEHNVSQGFLSPKGANVVFSLNAENLMGRPLQASAFFYFENGQPLRDYNRNYVTVSTGNVSVNINLTPAYASTVYTNVRMFIPYTELHLGSGKHNLKTNLAVFDLITGQKLAESGYVYFWWQSPF